MTEPAPTSELPRTTPAGPPPPDGPFGAVLAPTMVTATTRDGRFTAPEVHPVRPLDLSPAAHVLHYGSAVFEGLKAHRGTDDTVRLFRSDAHVERLRRSAARAHLPVPDTHLVAGMIHDVVAANLDEVPVPPGSLYVRPVLLGTEPNIGAAGRPSAEAMLFVVVSPVGDYFRTGPRPLRLYVETQLPRTAPQFGEVKGGANYVMGLDLIEQARRDHDADQVLFAPGGDVQETGASNLLLLDETRVVTRALDGSFLHGVTRDAVLTLARDEGLTVEERELPVDELAAWARRGGEIALSGTAAVLADVGELVLADGDVVTTSAAPGVVTARLRSALEAVQRGEAADPHGWTVPVLPPA